MKIKKLPDFENHDPLRYRSISKELRFEGVIEYTKNSGTIFEEQFKSDTS